MRSRLVLTAIFSLAATPLLAQTPAPAPDWNALGEQAAHMLAGYIQVNTTNPPGNELAGARYLKNILDREGIEAQILDTTELGPGRANLYARMRGNGKKKAIILLSHMDVVPAVPSFWKVPPFSGEIRDGYVWGRGAIDMKSYAIVNLLAMVQLKRSGIPLDRDIIFIGNADEELGSTGATVFTRRHADLIRDAEYLVTEGGVNEVVNGKLLYYGVGVAEKRTFWQSLTVIGVPSHASRPTPDNPVPKLVGALDRIAHYETPIHATPGVDKYFRDISVNYPEPQKSWLAHVMGAMANPEARKWILSNVAWNAYLRNTISITALRGSSKTNVIPPEAYAELDIRLLPDADTAQFANELRQVINDTSVHMKTIFGPKTPLEVPVNTDFFRAMERASHDRDPHALVTTPMFTAASDRPLYRALGIDTYGLDPFKMEHALYQEGMHGNNERISIENLAFGVHYVYDILRYAQ
ncbi:MAG: M20/M25/M40 family metallo-hydrolase [Gemmatimonadota bacterium]|nr:M20/M25/M40 family metallo-hydrolase [Gemmatimonadota bacterium]